MLSPDTRRSILTLPPIEARACLSSSPLNIARLTLPADFSFGRPGFNDRSSSCCQTAKFTAQIPIYLDFPDVKEPPFIHQSMDPMRADHWIRYIPLCIYLSSETLNDGRNWECIVLAIRKIIVRQPTNYLQSSEYSCNAVGRCRLGLYAGQSKPSSPSGFPSSRLSVQLTLDYVTPYCSHRHRRLLPRRPETTIPHLGRSMGFPRRQDEYER